MTAEIAILNRAAIAFAADSAVSIRVGNGHKIYNSGEKIFQFCVQQPIGLMVYNNAEFMNVPLEVIIRRFRTTVDVNRPPRPDEVFDTIQIATHRLVDFLSAFERSMDDEHAHLRRLLVDRFNEMQAHVIYGLRTNRKGRFVERLKEVLGQITKREKADALPNFLAGHDLADFRRQYGAPCIDAATLVFGNLAEGLDDLFIAYGFAVVKSGKPTDHSTGLVVGGFCPDKLFPSICSISVDGAYFKQLKIIPMECNEINRIDKRAMIFPYAQIEMAERFMYGVDEQFESAILTYVKEVSANAINGLVRQLAADEITAVMHDGLKVMLKDTKAYLRKELLSIVDHMSKSELAEMARAMVELTSMKRRFSPDAETVGGPIDVAVLSRHEGFIWISRKQYFDTKLNRHYVTRYGQDRGAIDARES